MIFLHFYLYKNNSTTKFLTKKKINTKFEKGVIALKHPQWQTCEKCLGRNILSTTRF